MYRWKLISMESLRNHADVAAKITLVVLSISQAAAVEAPKAFISHATADKFVAESIGRIVEAEGIQAFIDSHAIEGGDDIHQSVTRALEESTVVFVLITPRSLDSTWIWFEVGMAAAMKKRIVPLLHHVQAAELHRRASFMGRYRAVPVMRLQTELKKAIEARRVESRMAGRGRPECHCSGWPFSCHE